MPWVRNPHSGGVTIPEAVKEPTTKRILAHAERKYRGKFTRLDIRFRGPLCYVVAYKDPDTRGAPWRITKETREQFIERLRNEPTHLVRLRYFGGDRWSVAFFTYSHERYEPCFFKSGEMFGTPEEGLDVGAGYLT